MARPHSHKRIAAAATISMLSFLGTLLVVWALPRVSDAVAAWVSNPPVRSTETTLPAGLPVAAAAAPGSTAGARASATGADVSSSRRVVPAATIDPRMRFTLVGVICRPPASSRAAVIVRVRTSEDGSSWGRWYEAELERASENGGDEQAFTELIWTGAARYVQVAAVVGGRAGAPARLRGVRVVTINSTEDADGPAALVGAIRRVAATVAGIELSPPAAAMTTKPRIVTRSQWGADESWRSGSPSFAPVKMAFIHHTASGNKYSASEAPAIVRAVYHYHTKSMHWSDVAYSFLIDRYGTIYEGRYGGVTKGVIGAHVLGFNTGSTGVSIIGDYTAVTPPSAAVTSLERLLEWKLDVHHLDPEGTATLVCGYGEKYKTGQKVKFPVIAGHRDANFTGCPGDRLYRVLTAARKVVTRTGHPKIYGFIIDEPAISPNGDGVRERTGLGFTVSEEAAWRLEIRSADGTPVKHLSGEGTTVSETWTGTDDEDRRLPDGLYTIEVTATSASGEARPAVDTVRLDTVPPELTMAAVTPDRFSPNGDGHDDTATLTFEPVESGSARVSVVGPGGDVLRRVTGWQAVEASARKVEWDGRVSSGGRLVPAEEGASTLLLEVRDAAGNATSTSRRVTLDRTLRFTALSREAISPNGDGKYDSVTLEFSLTRAADVTAAIVRAGETVRELRADRLGAGAHSVTWDGVVKGGAPASSGAYQFRLTADGALGASSLAESVTADLTAPRITAARTSSTRRRVAAKVPYRVKDADSDRIKVNVTVKDAKARVVAKISCGWISEGDRHVCKWVPKRKGVYRMVFRAVDRGGNPMAAVARTKLKVR